MPSVETEKKVCRWCSHPDRKVNVQGFCCQLCYNSWFLEQQKIRQSNYVEQQQAKKEKDAIS